MTPDEGEESGLEVDWNSRDRCRSYVPNLFDRRLHDLVLVPSQLSTTQGLSVPHQR